MMVLVSTHPQFSLRKDEVLATQAVTFIRLHSDSSENDYFSILGVLNSSTACFWLKQVSHGKGNGGVNEGYRGDEWEEFY
jgi:hypothetical protein